MGRTRGPSEKAITAAVLQHWKAVGRRDTLVASIPNQWAHGQAGLTRGLPDFLVMGPDIPPGGDAETGGCVGFIELKTDDGVCSPAQIEFRALCKRLGVAHAFTFGRDQPISVLREWGVIP